MKTVVAEQKRRSQDFSAEFKRKANLAVIYFLVAHFAVGLALAHYHDTWLIAFGAGALSLLAYFFVKLALPHSLERMGQNYEKSGLREKDMRRKVPLAGQEASEHAILKNEKLYRQIVETAQEGVWMLDENNVTVFVNKKMSEILGYSPGEMVGKTNFEFMDDEAKELAVASLNRRKQGIKEDLEFRFIAKDGRTVWTSLAANPVTNDDGSYKGALAMVTDITEKKKAAEKILHTEQLLSEAQRLAGVGNWNVNFETNEIFWSDGLKAIKGVSSDFEPSFEAFIALLHPEDKNRVASAIAKSKETGSPLEDTYRIIRQDNQQVRVIHAVTRFEKNKSGKSLRIYGMSQDITELKSAQAELEKTLKELERRVEERTHELFVSREFFSKTLQSLGDGVISTDATGQITFMNATAESLTGYALHEVLGKPVEFACNLLDERTRLPIENPIKVALRENKVVYMPDNVIMFRKDGSYNYMDDSAAPIHNEHKEIVGAVIIFKDITEKALYAKKLQAAHQEIREKNQSITDSILYAKNIQESTMPEIDLLNAVYPESFVIFKPKDIVSGDFYWFARQGDKFVVVVADCTGHGVPGAFMSMIGCGFLNEIVHRNKVTQPAEILRKLNKRIRRLLKTNIKENQSRDGMDIAICTIDNVSYHLEFAGANRSLVHFQNGNLMVTKGDKYGVGGTQQELTREYTNHEVSYTEGDTIYMFTDGFGDQFGGESGRKLMSANLLKMLVARHQMNMSGQKKIYSEHFEEWKGGLEQTDDVLMVGIRLAS